MKKLLSLLSVLCLAVSSWAQTATEHLLVQYPAGTTVYKMTALRNTATYPSNDAGWADFLQAIKNNAIERIAENGCPIAVGVPTPITLPTCSTATVPSWITGLRYKYESPQKLTFEAKGGIGQLKLVRVDGQAFNIPNPDNVPIENDKYYGYGSITGDPDGYDRRWQINIPAVALRVTFQQANGSATYTATLTPSLSAGTIQLAGSGSSNCNVALAVNSPSTSCGGSVQLTATASGSDASGLAYSWSNGMSGASISITAPSTNGSFPYTVTATKNGCNKSATATVTVTGCTSTTVAPPSGGYYAYRADTYDYPTYPDGSTSDPMPVFENDEIKVVLSLANQVQGGSTPGMGGAVYKVFNKKAPNPNHTLLFNANRYPGDDNAVVDRSGPPSGIFTGQGLSDCLYKLPWPYETDANDGAAGSSYYLNIDGQKVKRPGTDPGLGKNPNEVGDDLMNSGRLLKYEKRADGQAFHIQTHPATYGQNGLWLPGIMFEKWGELKGRTLEMHYQANFNENVTDRVVSKGQENPCVYFNGKLNKFYWYDGEQPYTNEGLTEIVAPLSPNGNALGGTNGGRPNGQYLSEPAIYAIGDDGYGIGLLIPNNHQAAYGFWGDGGFDAANPSMGGTYGSITASAIEILDHVMKWRHSATVLFGTLAQMRQEVYNHTYRPDFIPRFKWNRSGREGWYLNSGDAPDIHTWDDPYNGQTKDGWKVYFDAGYDAVISSPATILKANQTQTIYLKYKYSGNQTEWALSWQRNAQRPTAANGGGDNPFAGEDAIRYRNGEGNTNAQTVKFQVIPDGQEHVAVINVGANSNWKGVINRLNIRPHATFGGQYNAGESATLYWLNNQNADPFPN